MKDASEEIKKPDGNELSDEELEEVSGGKLLPPDNGKKGGRRDREILLPEV